MCIRTRGACVYECVWGAGCKRGKGRGIEREVPSCSSRKVERGLLGMGQGKTKT